MTDEIVTVRGCARCGETHEQLTFKALDAPQVDSDGAILTHSAPCPKTGRAILLGTIPLKKAQNTIPASVNYRKADDPSTSCNTCAYFDRETDRCAMFDVVVAPGYVCDKWSDVVKRIKAALDLSGYGLRMARLKKRARVD